MRYEWCIIVERGSHNLALSIRHSSSLKLPQPKAISPPSSLRSKHWPCPSTVLCVPVVVLHWNMKFQMQWKQEDSAFIVDVYPRFSSFAIKLRNKKRAKPKALTWFAAGWKWPPCSSLLFRHLWSRWGSDECRFIAVISVKDNLTDFTERQMRFEKGYFLSIYLNCNNDRSMSRYLRSITPQSICDIEFYPDTEQKPLERAKFNRTRWCISGSLSSYHVPLLARS